MASLCSSWRWIIIMVAGALPFVIVVAREAMLILVAAAVRVVIMARSFPSLGSAVSAGFPSWRIVSASSVTASPSLAIIVAYDDSFLWDFERLILWWQHVGLMDFSAGLCHLVCHRRILGWHLPGCELLFL
jgi:hypothetical protein